LGVNPATAVVHCDGRRWIAAIALASLQSSESNPHCPHRSTLTFPILPYRLVRSHLPGVRKRQIPPPPAGIDEAARWLGEPATRGPAEGRGTPPIRTRSVRLRGWAS